MGKKQRTKPSSKNKTRGTLVAAELSVMLQLGDKLRQLRASGLSESEAKEKIIRELCEHGAPERTVKALLARIHIPSREETVEFITRPIDLGQSAPYTPLPQKPPGKRGPKRKPEPLRNQYDDAYDRRKDIYHRRERLPKAGTKTLLGIGDKHRSPILEVAKELPPNTPKHKRCSEIQKRMAERKKPRYDETTIRRALRKTPPG